MYTAFIQTDKGSYNYHAPLGNDEQATRDMCIEIYNSKPAKATYVSCVMLKLDGKTEDLFEGKWWVSELWPLTGY